MAIVGEQVIGERDQTSLVETLAHASLLGRTVSFLCLHSVLSRSFARYSCRDSGTTICTRSVRR